jgi:hypothetical protein
VAVLLPLLSTGPALSGHGGGQIECDQWWHGETGHMSRSLAWIWWRKAWVRLHIL